MADEPNGRRPILTRETLVPWGAAVAFACLSALGVSKYADLREQIITSSVATNERMMEQSRVVALQIQALTFTVEAQGRDIAQVKSSVETLSRAAEK